MNMGQLGTLLPFILMFVIFYFLLIRPQQKRQKERNSMLNSVKKGDQIITAGGVHGTITELNDTTYGLRVAHNVVLTYERSSIASVVKSATGAAAAPAADVEAAKS